MPSLASRTVEWLLPLSGFKRLLRSEEALRNGLPSLRRQGPALPSALMRRRLAIAEQWIDGSRVFTIARRNGKPRPHILYLHGGGYFADIVRAHWSLIGRLLAAVDCTVTVPLYPLAPEHTSKEVFAVLMPLCRELLLRYGPYHVTFMGDSAGGGLALALAQQLRDQHEPLPGRLVLISPWLDVTLSDIRQPQLATRDGLLDIPGARAAGLMYAGGLAPTDPRISPLFGSLQGLPITAIFTGTHDPLFPDADRFKQKAESDGLALCYHKYEGLFHVWLGVPLPESARAMRQIAAFVCQPGVDERLAVAHARA